MGKTFLEKYTNFKIISNTFFPNDNHPNHIKALDGVRGLAVLFVVIAHGSEMTDSIDFLYNFKFLGRLGVFIFFVLSAYLLDMYIANALINNKANTMYWANYFLRRFLRIFPLFIFSLVIYWGMEELRLIDPFISTYRDIIKHIFFVDAKAMYWSIGVEFKYYIISPIILIICNSVLRWKKKQVIAFILAFIFLTLLVFSLLPYRPFRLINYMPFFLCGTLISLSEVYDKPIVDMRILNISIPINLIFIMFGITTFYDLINVYNSDFNLIYLTFAPFIALLIYSVRNNKFFFSKIFEMYVLRFIGNISFSLYLFHVLFIFLIDKYGFQNSFANTISYILLSIGFSALTYSFIEYPLSKIRLIKKAGRH